MSRTPSDNFSRFKCILLKFELKKFVQNTDGFFCIFPLQKHYNLLQF